MNRPSFKDFPFKIGCIIWRYPICRRNDPKSWVSFNGSKVRLLWQGLLSHGVIWLSIWNHILVQMPQTLSHALRSLRSPYSSSIHRQITLHPHLLLWSWSTSSCFKKIIQRLISIYQLGVVVKFIIFLILGIHLRLINQLNVILRNVKYLIRQIPTSLYRKFTAAIFLSCHNVFVFAHLAASFYLSTLSATSTQRSTHLMTWVLLNLIFQNIFISLFPSFFHDNFNFLTFLMFWVCI